MPKLPDERCGVTHKFSIAGHEGYLTVNTFDDGTPGEIFIVMAKVGSSLSGFVDSFAMATSMLLQSGTPLQELVDKFSYTRFEPAGYTTNSSIPQATSVLDYVFRWLAQRFLEPCLEPKESESAPPCPVCGTLLLRAGDSFTCPTCR
jgi:ribonucleoside-diphosphate reductase alpha chain